MKIVKGNLLTLAEQGHFNVIVQGCNCFCAMGSGIAKEIREKYPEAYDVDQATGLGDYNKLGNYTVMLGKRFNIVNAYTQYDTNKKDEFRDRFEYASFAMILQKLAHQYPTCNFGFPKIGCGLAGGDEQVIMDMLQEFSANLLPTGGTVTVVEFA
jgi:O-acetyl-ADP-ribose deacetylase (regulator of RNase III)